MPVRIYDIAKRLGVESKEVLAKAKELGITNAKVASSSLDKITGEYLEDELRKLHPPPAPPVASVTVEPPPPVPEPKPVEHVVVIARHPPEVPAEAPAPPPAVAEITPPSVAEIETVPAPEPAT